MRVPVLLLDLMPSGAASSSDTAPLPLAGSLKVALALLAGIALGLGTTAWLLERRIDIVAIHAGPWAAWPRVGTSDIDPYARAIYAKSGQIALAASEGVLLVARQDDDGNPLVGTCTYGITGSLPSSQTWTLEVATPDGMPIDNPAGRYAFTSSELLRRADGNFVIDVAAMARPGNWLPVSRGTPFVLALRLYDSQFGATAAAFDKKNLPSITQRDCAP